VLIDERELTRRSIEIEDLRHTLGHEIMPVLLRNPDAKEDFNPLLERTFISIVNPASSGSEFAGALDIGAAAGPQAMFRNPPEEAARPERPLHILVADDNVMNQKVFTMILGRAGHQVTVAGDGEAALDVMKDHAVDIVLMDVNMPVLNGIEATKLYRFTALGRKRIPIVGITADASAETSERCIEAGMDACVSKPVEAGPLLDLLSRLTDAGDAPAITNFDPSGVVTPLFRADTPNTTAINWDKLRDLEELGGQEFVADLLGQ
jgi:two-component system sensor histidine kinase RpfC